MSITADTLFDQMEQPVDRPTSPTGAVVFLSNRQNVLEILSAGLIGGTSSYHKYYTDLLALSPGRIPLLRAPVGGDIAQLASEDEELAFPVALELGADRMPTGMMPALAVNGESIHATLIDPEAVAWAPDTVIPLTAVVALHFRSEAEREEFELRRYENVRVDVPLLISPQFFAGTGSAGARVEDWLRALSPGTHPTAEQHDAADRLAGARALVAVVSSARSLSGLAEFLSADAASKRGYHSKTAGDFPLWIQRGITTVDEDWRPAKELEVRLFQSAARVFQTVDRSREWRPLELLAAIDNSMRSDKLTKKDEAELKRYLDSIRAILRTEKEFKPFREGHGSDVAKALLLVLMRPDPVRLLAWRREETGANEWVMLTAAAFSGLLNGHKRLPVTLREVGLDRFLAVRSAQDLGGMVGYAWADGEDVILEVDEAEDGEDTLARILWNGNSLIIRRQPRPTLAKRISALDLTQQINVDAAIDACRLLGWADCVSAVIEVDGEFAVKIRDRRSCSIRVSGFPVTHLNLDSERFLQRLDEDGVPSGYEARVRERFTPLLQSDMPGAAQS